MIKVAFLDRDGTINIDYGYVVSREKFEFVDGIFEVCNLLKDLGFKLIVVTNQSGIARGYYSEQDFLDLSKWIHGKFNKQGIPLLDIFYCPHHPQAVVSYYRETCRCRKPFPGMIEQACDKYSIDLKKSIMIGDQVSDMQAAKAGGIGKFYLLNRKVIVPQALGVSAQLDNLEQLKYFDFS